ncbi:MAG: DUF1571 domain-containing protein [Bacteroidia bacterium]|nr:DUF1571 domain-containing protein [Bacteroidia bacterium]
MWMNLVNSIRPLFISLIFITCPVAAQTLSADELFDKMLAAMKEVRTASFVLDINERIRGEMKHDQFVVKLNAKPFKVYVYSVTPNPGAEALIITGENNNKALINPNMRLIPSLSLSPYHQLLRKNHQYTLLHIGFDFVYRVCSGYKQKFGNSFSDYLESESEIIWKGQSYYQLVIQSDNFHWTDYTVQQGENLVSIAKKLLVNDYMILEHNRRIKNFDDVKPGQIIRVPSVFGKKIVFYIDKRTFLPLVQIVYDDKGLYSRIEMSSYIHNPLFTIDDFSRKNKKYGF